MILGWLVRTREVRFPTIIIITSFEDRHTCRYHKFLKCKLFYQESDLNSAGRAEEWNWFEFGKLGFRLRDRGNPPSSGHKTQTQYAPERININLRRVM